MNVAMLSFKILETLALFTVAFSDLAVAETETAGGFGPSAYTAPGAFPTSVYKHYYNSPTATSAQPQPVIYDPVSVSTSTVRRLLFRLIH